MEVLIKGNQSVLTKIKHQYFENIIIKLDEKRNENCEQNTFKDFIKYDFREELQGSSQTNELEKYENKIYALLARSF